MQVEIDWRECIKDSPKFRSMVLDQEKDLELLETHLEKLVKHCDAIVEAGRYFQAANNNFLSHLQSLMIHFKDDTSVLEAIGNFTETLTSWHQVHYTMLERCNSSFSQNINTFVKNDLKRVKDSRKHFHKMSDDVESAFSRNAQVSKSRVEECEGAASNLTVARNNFKKSSLDYLFEISVVQVKKRFEILNCLLTYLNGHENFLEQNHSTFDKLKPYFTDLNVKVQLLKEGAVTNRQTLRKDLNMALDFATNPILEESISSTISNNQDLDSGDMHMEGYLYKRTSNAFKSWVRRWFIVENNQLLYCSQHRSRDGAVVLERDLRLCNVMSFQDTERRFCFQIVSPIRTHLLQADNEKDCQLWVNTIQETARKAYSKMHSPPQPKSTSIADLRVPYCSPSRCQSTKLSSAASVQKIPSHIKSIFSIEGNNECCDCGHPDPRWASFNLGITLCIECSGIHRSFGVHKSKVKSVTLDAWEVDQVKVMEQLGNVIVRKIFEANVDETFAERATPNCPRNVREAWITAKYIKKAFVRSSKSSSSCQSSSPKPLPRSASLKLSSDLENCKADDDGDGDDDDGDDIISNKDENDIKGRLCTLKADSPNVLRTVFKSGPNGPASPLPPDLDSSYWLSIDADKPIEACRLLCRAAALGTLIGMLRALALGADPNFRNTEDGGKTPLIYSLTKGELAPVEFILLHGAKVDIIADNQQAALHYASIYGNAGQICLLLKRKANHHLKDVNGRDPLSIAVEKADANVVTILRLARLNDDMRKGDGGFDNPSDDMFAQVFRDFSAISNNNNNPTATTTAAATTASVSCSSYNNYNSGCETLPPRLSSSVVTLPSYKSEN